MHGTTFSINDSIQELLASAGDCTDQEVLLPVIESLVQELSFNQTSTEQAYRQLVIDLASALIDSEMLGQEAIKQFNWLKKLASDGHDICALQALVKNLKAGTLPDSVATVTQQPVPATPERQPDTPEQPTEEESAATVIEKPEDGTLDFNQLARPVLNGQAPDLLEDNLDENQFNDQEIRTLKNTLQHRLDSTKTQCKEFESLMQLLLTDLREANNEAELETTRAMLKRSVSRLLTEHQTISSNLIDVASELNRYETHCDQLNHELGLVKRLSMTDELTRLPNRRAFLKRLQNESGRVQRYGYPLSVAILDLDLFKEINDTYGHAVGDEVLKAYTQNVLSTFRNYDLVARYGGEEFAVLLPHTDIYGAERALNKVLQKTAETKLASIHEGTTIRLPSFSAGVAVYKEGEPIESVINRADKAMYSAKKMGRNRVVVETDEVS